MNGVAPDTASIILAVRHVMTGWPTEQGKAQKLYPATNIFVGIKILAAAGVVFLFPGYPLEASTKPTPFMIVLPVVRVVRR